jgi:hypothetical protein
VVEHDDRRFGTADRRGIDYDMSKEQFPHDDELVVGEGLDMPSILILGTYELNCYCRLFIDARRSAY